MQAWARDQCIFRELVPVGSDALATAMAALRDTPPALLYKPANSDTVREPSIQESHEGGQICQFDNEEVSAAEIRLTASLPYPADLSMYPAMLGAYAVTGRAKIIMVTDPKCAGRPHALRFLGQTPSWEYRSGFAGSRLTVEIGGNGSLIEKKLRCRILLARCSSKLRRVKLAISDVARLTGGEQFGEHRVVSGAAVDSRTVKGGELFVPLRAARDGHDWISAALAAGAAAYLTELEPRGGDRSPGEGHARGAGRARGARASHHRCHGDRGHRVGRQNDDKGHDRRRSPYDLRHPCERAVVQQRDRACRLTLLGAPDDAGMLASRTGGTSATGHRLAL